jgi:hypothetical protein
MSYSRIVQGRPVDTGLTLGVGPQLSDQSPALQTVTPPASLGFTRAFSRNRQQPGLYLVECRAVRCTSVAHSSRAIDAGHAPGLPALPLPAFVPRVWKPGVFLPDGGQELHWSSQFVQENVYRNPLCTLPSALPSHMLRPLRNSKLWVSVQWLMSRSPSVLGRKSSLTVQPRTDA